jgi:serine/threonine-protein kinase
MNSDYNPGLDHGGQENVMERSPKKPLAEINDLIAAALIGRLPDLPPDADEETCQAQLSPETRAALDALGTSDQLVDRLFDRLQATRYQRSAPAASTFMTASAQAETVLSGGPPTLDPTPAFEELLQRYDACHQIDYFQTELKFSRKREIGQGGQGVVYLGENDFLGEAALKIMSPLPYGGPEAYFEDMLRMRAVASVVHQNYQHNLVHVERFESINGIFVLIMQLVHGYDLARLLHPHVMGKLKHHVDQINKDRWPWLSRIVFANLGSGRVGLQPAIAIYIVHKVLLALRALHKKRIVHADLKPSNIMLSKDGCVTLIDIGSAFQLDSPPRQFAWSPRYAPPEVLRGEPWTIQADFASLGYVLLELLSGRPDLGGPLVTAESGEQLSKQLLDDHLKVKSTLANNLRALLPPGPYSSEVLRNLCTMLIHDDPARRFDAADSALDYCDAFRRSLVVGNLDTDSRRDIQYWVSDAMDAMTPSD